MSLLLLEKIYKKNYIFVHKRQFEQMDGEEIFLNVHKYNSGQWYGFQEVIFDIKFTFLHGPQRLPTDYNGPLTNPTPFVCQSDKTG